MLPSEERCPRCTVQIAYCMCPHLESPIETHAHVVIVRHAREKLRPTNTAAIAAMTLARATLADYGEIGAPVIDIDGLIPEGAWLLYPDAREGASLVVRGAPPPSALMVLDGTWSQTQRLVRRHPRLGMLPRCALPPGPREWRPHLRHSDDPDRLLTMEAIAIYLALHEPGDAGARLMKMHRRFVAATLASRGQFVPPRWVETGATT